MTLRQNSLLGGLLVGGALGALALPAAAQSPDGAGVVRISDRQPGAVVPASGSAMAPGLGSGANCYTNGYGNSYGRNGAYDPYCPNGRCPPGHRLGGLFHHHEQGFSIPVKNPIYRTQVPYQHLLKNPCPPTGGYGGPTAPLVYMPTDTTQLGYYYQHVPYWQPQAGRIPPAPYPADWHNSLYGTLSLVGHPHGLVLGNAAVNLQSMQPQGEYCPPGGQVIGQPAPQPAAQPELQPIPILQQQDPPAAPAPVAGASLDRAAEIPKLLPIE